MAIIVKIPADQSISLTQENIDSTSKRGDIIPDYLETACNDDNAVIDTTVLIRHSEGPSIDTSAGLYAYSISSTSFTNKEIPNVRATRLAMACGMHDKRFMNEVYVGRLGYTSSGLVNVDLTIGQVEAAVLSPDLRESALREMIQLGVFDPSISVEAAPDWLCLGAQKNYHDNKSMAELAVAMARSEMKDDAKDDDESHSSARSDVISDEESTTENDGNQAINEPTRSSEVTLCLYCRRPASTLCSGCHGAYFCEEPRRCKMIGWSHQCLCPTWKLYVQHREALSHFPFFTGWHLPLLQEECYSSDARYQKFLVDTLRVISAESGDETEVSSKTTTWWSTEIHGWNGGKSKSAKLVDLFRRVSYIDGLGLDKSLIPEERAVSSDDIQKAGLAVDDNKMPMLTSWEDYYRLRSIPLSSPIALLATFPLTVYHAIQRHGIVPITVSQMLGRPMRIHVVGIEKELNFIDFFQEVGFLLPADIEIEMTWVVRADMFPDATTNSGEQEAVAKSTLLSLQLASNLSLSVIGGTYGEGLDPNFDIKGGAPDMVIGLNAGLYAYESWRHVVSYLFNNPNVLGVFTDYNEHSGMNCASLSGAKSRKSLHVCAFRQPRAMPVSCMNLPQFSNGFMYVFNEQELE